MNGEMTAYVTSVESRQSFGRESKWYYTVKANLVDGGTVEFVTTDEWPKTIFNNSTLGRIKVELKITVKDF